jgi:hypothetical protein
VPVHILPKSLEEEIGKEDMKIITRESIGLGGVTAKTFTVNETLYVSKSFSASMPEVRGGETLYSLAAVGVEKEDETEWIAKVSDAAESLRELITTTKDASVPEVKEAIELWLTESSSFITPDAKKLASEGSSLLAQFAGKAGVDSLAKLFHLVLTRQPFLIESSAELDPRLITFLSPNRKTLILKNPSDENLQVIRDALIKESENPEIPRTVAVYQFDDEAGHSTMAGESAGSIELEEAILQSATRQRSIQAISYLKSFKRGWIVILKSALSVIQNQRVGLAFFDGSWHNLGKNGSYEVETNIISEALKEKEMKRIAVINNEVLKLNAWARKFIGTIYEWEISREDLRDQLSVDQRLFNLVEEICKGEYGVDLSDFYGKKRRK